MARNRQEHYCIADNLLKRVEMSQTYIKQGRVAPEDRDTLELARTHALMASLRVEQDHVDRWNGSMDRLL